MFHCCARETTSLLNAFPNAKKMMWILIHRPILWALWIKIHVCRLCFTNIYTFLICPFYSASRDAHHHTRRHFPYRKTVSTILPKAIHSINIASYFICSVSLFLIFFVPFFTLSRARVRCVYCHTFLIAMLIIFRKVRPPPTRFMNETVSEVVEQHSQQWNNLQQVPAKVDDFMST